LNVCRYPRRKARVSVDLCLKCFFQKLSMREAVRADGDYLQCFSPGINKIAASTLPRVTYMTAVGADVSTAGSPVYDFVNMAMFACGWTPACPFPVAFPSVKQEATRYSSSLHICCKTQQVTCRLLQRMIHGTRIKHVPEQGMRSTLKPMRQEPLLPRQW
jgi:hypothetical protein